MLTLEVESHFALGSSILIPFFFAHNSKQHFPRHHGSEIASSVASGQRVDIWMLKRGVIHMEGLFAEDSVR